MSRRSWLLLFFIILKFALQFFLINPVYDLQRDEYLYLDQANHPAWGYASVPPLTSWNSLLIKALGNSVFLIKFFPALYGCLTLFLVWKMVERLNGNLFACCLSAVTIIFSVILRLNILYQPNSFDVLSWTALYFAIIAFIQTKKSRWLWIAGLVFAFGFLNKYNIAFLTAGLVPAFLITSERKIFLNKHLYFAAAIGFVLILPNLIWQYQNDFPVVKHLQELAATQLVNVDRFGFLKAQIMFFLSGIFVLIVAFISFFVYPPFKKFRFVFWSFWFTLILFLYFRAKDYYTIGLYPVLIAFGSVYLEHLLSSLSVRFARWVVVLIPILIFVPMMQYIFPILTPDQIYQKREKFQALGLTRWEDGKEHNLPQDFADMLGWKAIAAATDSVYQTIDDKEHTLVFADNYGEAGAVNYYSTIKNLKAVSLNADYINWFPKNKSYRQILIVKERDDDESDDPEMKTEHSLFNSIEFKWRLNNPYARENGARIYLLSDPKVNLNKVIEQMIREGDN